MCFVELGMKTYFSSLFILAAMLLVGGTSEVMERNSTYSCCEKPTIKFDQHCENTWSINNKPFAYSSSLTKNYIYPCKEIEGGQMMLDSCVEINVVTVCTDEMGVIQERRIRYYGQRCSASVSNHAGSQGLVGLLLVVLITGYFVKK